MQSGVKVLQQLFRIHAMSIATLVAATLAAGCRPGSFDVSVDLSQSGFATLTIDNVKGNCGTSGAAEISSIQIYKKLPSGKVEEAWRLTSQIASGQKISTIVYGVPPVGFIEHRAAKNLEAGQTYDVLVSGNGCIGGALFTVK